ncbi:MAG: hypothetical protein SGJ18_08790 [Pseudomonadota bacterium]|nr:hypothetical protein [Pseudomonadota bacterium]
MFRTKLLYLAITVVQFFICNFALAEITRVYVTDSAGLTDFDFTPVGKLIGSCAEGNGLGEVVPFSANLSGYRFRCTVNNIVTESDFAAKGIFQRNGIVGYLNFETDANDDAIIFRYDKKRINPPFITQVVTQDNRRRNTALGVVFEVTCSEEYYGHKDCTEASIREMAQKLSDLYGSRLTRGALGIPKGTGDCKDPNCGQPDFPGGG